VKVLQRRRRPPQFVKLGPIAHEFAKAGDIEQSSFTPASTTSGYVDVFFKDLDIPAPYVHLGVGSGSHGVQTGAMLSALDAVLDELKPDWTLVYGDTNSTNRLPRFAAVKTATYQSPTSRQACAASTGAWPEEHNRVLTDHAADLLLAPTEVRDGATSPSKGWPTAPSTWVMSMADVCFTIRDAVKHSPC